jgi:HEAT repeat protein
MEVQEKLRRHWRRFFPVYAWGLSGLAFAAILVAAGLLGLAGKKLWAIGLFLLLLNLFEFFLFAVFHFGGRFFYWLWTKGLPDPAKHLGSRNAMKRSAAFALLLHQGEKAVPIFAQLLSDPSWRVEAPFDWDDKVARMMAAKGLGTLKASEGVDALVAALDDATFLVREAVIWALGEIGDPKAIPALLPLLGEPLPDSDWARKALKKLHQGKIVDAWHKVLRERDETALQTLRPWRMEIAEALLRGLERQTFSEPIALNAVWALKTLGVIDALPRLQQLAHRHPSEQVRQACGQVAKELEMLTRLPKPATTLPPDIATLPRPASPQAVDFSRLPALPSDGK